MQKPNRAACVPGIPHRSLPAKLFLIVAAASIATAFALDQDWSPRVGEALSLYRARQFDQALALARTLADSEIEASARADARAIQVLIDLRTGDRAARQHARTALVQLEENHPGILDRPESLCALGVASTALGETNAALDLLERAFVTLRAQDRLAEAADTLVAIAHAWSVHGEWEITPARLIQERPRSPEEARDLRLAKTLGARNRVEQLGDFPQQRDQIDLLVGRMQLSDPSSAATGEQSLAHLADKASPDFTSAQAAAALAEHASILGHLHEARRWWESAAQGPDPDVRRNAQAALDRLTRAPIAIQVQSRAQGLQITLQGSHTAGVLLEVRTLDAGRWLAAQRGRANEALLPEDGRVEFTHELSPDSPASQPHQTSPALTVEASIPPGAYVLLARNATDPAHKVLAKRLAIHQPIPTTAIIGPTRAAICAVAPEKTNPTSTEFWIQGGFAPRTIRLQDGVAVFDLPPEARVLVSRRWTLLIRSGPRIALLEGAIPGEAKSDAGAVAAILAGPDRLGPLQTCYIAGVLCDPSMQVLRPSDELTLELCDARGETIASAAAELHEGLLCGRIPLNVQIAPENLHVIARHRGQVLPLAGGRVGVATSLATLPLSVTTAADQSLPREAKDWPVQWQVRWPWGAPAEGLTFSTTMRQFEIPSPARPLPQSQRPLSEHGELDARGIAALDFPLSELQGAQLEALLLGFSVTAHGSAQGIHHFRALRGDARARSLAWVVPLSVDVRVGEPVTFWAGWLDLRQPALVGPPKLIIGDGESASDLDLRWGAGGWRSESWLPPKAGQFVAKLAVPRVSGPPLSVETPLHVLEPANPSAAEIHFSASLQSSEDGLAVAFNVRNAPPGSDAYVCLMDDEPRMIHRLPSFGTHESEFRLIWDRPRAPTRVLLLRCGSEHNDLLAVAPIVVPSQSNLRFTSAEPVVAGAEARIPYSGFDPAALGSKLLLCLTRASDPGYQAQAADVPSEPLEMPLEIISSIAGRIDASAGTPTEHPGILGVDAIIRPREELLWAQLVTPKSASGELAIPVPAQGRYFRLRAISARGGTPIAAETVLDARDSLQISVDYPNSCSAGDRPWVSAAITNPTNNEQRCTVKASGSPGVTVDGLIGADQQIVPTAEKSLRIPAGQSAWVCWATEVLAAPEGSFEIAVEREGARRQTVQRQVQITRTSTGGADSTVRIRRELFLAEEEPAKLGHHKPRPQWKLHALPSDAALRTGQLVLVRETIDVQTDLRGVTWRQRLPGTAVARGLPSDTQGQFVQLAQLRRSSYAAYEFSTPFLATGQHRHEYMLQAARPGVCFLPPPEVIAAGRPNPPEISPEVRLQVLPGSLRGTAAE